MNQQKESTSRDKKTDTIINRNQNRIKEYLKNNYQELTLLNEYLQLNMQILYQFK